jgi:hypothetical protein
MGKQYVSEEINNMRLNPSEENNLVDISEKISEVSQGRGISWVFLHEVYAQNYKEISEFTGKKFVGVDSRMDVLLDWAFTQDGIVKDPIVEHYRRYHHLDSELVGLRAKQEGIIEQMKYQTCKWKNEREGTK